MHHEPHAVCWHCIENTGTQVFVNSYDVIKGSIPIVLDEPVGVLCKSTWNKYLIRHRLSFGITPTGSSYLRCDQLLVVNCFISSSETKSVFVDTLSLKAYEWMNEWMNVYLYTVLATRMDWWKDALKVKNDHRSKFSNF